MIAQFVRSNLRSTKNKKSRFRGVGAAAVGSRKAMNRLGNLWRCTAGQLGAAASGLLQQACPGTQVRDPWHPQAGSVHPCAGAVLCARCTRAGRGGRVCVPAHAASPAVDARAQRDMVRLRLQRFGVRNNPFYRIVAADARWPRDGKHLELLGSAPRLRALVRSAACTPCFLSRVSPACVPSTLSLGSTPPLPTRSSAAPSPWDSDCIPGPVPALGDVCVCAFSACHTCGPLPVRVHRLASAPRLGACALSAWRRLVLRVREAVGCARDALHPA